MEEEKEVVVPETTTEVTPEVTPEEEVDWKAKAEKAEELAKNYKIRAEKAEGKIKEVKVETEPKNEGMSLKDIRALQDVHDDDVDELVEYAKFKKISISEAKKLPEMQALLSSKAEFRKSSEAANTGTSKRSSGKIPDDVLLSNASKGVLPESDDDLKRLFDLRKGIKK